MSDPFLNGVGRATRTRTACAEGEEGLSQLLIKLGARSILGRDVFVVADPELRIVLSDQLGDALDRGPASAPY
jgi:hypothetical protein